MKNLFKIVGLSLLILIILGLLQVMVMLLAPASIASVLSWILLLPTMVLLKSGINPVVVVEGTPELGHAGFVGIAASVIWLWVIAFGISWFLYWRKNIKTDSELDTK